MAEAIVIGGGIAGLGAALALSRGGHHVTVLEKDSTPLPESAVLAFERWDRRGAPQVRHSHAFLARFRNLLRDRAPDVLDALMRNGAYDLRITEMLPPTIDDRSAKPGDEDLVLLGCRRLTLEWVLHKIVAESPGVVWHDGSEVLGLETLAPRLPGSPPRVRGVRARRPGAPAETLRADLVVDASGRRSTLSKWLTEIGAPPIQAESEDCGIFYSSRFYRLRPRAEEPPRDGPIGADLGYMKFAVFSGDSRIFSVTLAASPEDTPMRRVLRPGPFEAAANAIPAIRTWLEPDRSEPVTGVYGMAGLRNRRRLFMRDGAPVALGVHAIGDAAIHTNPLYGRGCSLAFVHAYLLADALREHGDDAEALAFELERDTRREIEPWYRSAVTQDRDACDVAAQQRRGEDPFATEAPSGARVVDPTRFMRSVLRDGLLPALRTDAVVMRAFLRNFNLLETPDSLLTNGDVMRRVLAAWRERDQRAPAEPLGPGRAEMVRVLEQAA
ncbi:MAG TPA: FAD-dependent oxidoreductase [Myxococcota bacterium]|nr:FAD-dependent oxidoreductase [Myxococcota bacterium]